MKLNVKNIRYLSPDDWRVLTATEMGSRNHEVVPTPLISQIASLRSGNGVHNCISNLAKIGLIAKVKNAKYDGYRLTYGGLDYLALHTHTKGSVVYSVGNQIGVGKESDIFVCASESGRQLVLKIHRLGRISFRTVKANRDYLRNRQSGSWMYMSRLAALKEYEFMKALHREGFPVPEPVGQNRHTVIMGLVDAFPMRQISKVGDASTLYAELLAQIVRFAQYGLIHGDFNEFNILVEERDQPDGTVSLIPTIIDFPQMVSIDHANAEYYFDRDVACIKRFFDRRFGFTSDEPGPFFKDAIKTITKRLDVEVQASGFSKKMAKELEVYMKEHGIDGDAGEAGVEREDGDDVEAEEVEVEAEAEAEAEVEAEDLAPEDGPVQPPADEQTPSVLAHQMTILDIRDTDPLPDLSEVKPPPQPTISTKAAKKKAGWAI
ncbi:non-specific serine/threonine protein kinase [Parastagonospora nodorum]|nr:non-specific serine/threonine protein kinase [Parastagonospora nodorum]KAH4161070.1 non-specific serine/threonine protein kinase [Parastagonospora nodorum]KAH4292360.1 non-specific serine/threonine protein kinase [Parastagonospora nodorum]KAH4293131.1 non-specific serine/threonine protein kinase [Parastagonospora nodorum]KAH4324053.1 non-specific serine/threonine protein kinase [Parastagonospora nodorum]